LGKKNLKNKEGLKPEKPSRSFAKMGWERLDHE
jgi:hypothetical protein